jgi:hypothetical protein
MSRWRVLTGLPATGPPPEQFSATGRGTHREGLVVEVVPDSGDPWIGNFQGGIGGLADVFAEPGTHHLIVVAEGTAYVVDPETRTLVRTFGGGLELVIEDLARHQLIFSNGLWFEAVGGGGTRWRSRRVSWDGLRSVRIEDGAIRGEAFSPFDDDWHGFGIDLADGAAVGGCYSEPQVRLR